MEQIELETRKISILEVVSKLQNNDILLQIELILQKQAKELFYKVQAERTQDLLNITQKPRRITTDLEQLAKEQNYNPRKKYLIGAINKELKFRSL